MSCLHLVSKEGLESPSPHSKGSGKARSRLPTPSPPPWVQIPLHPHLPPASGTILHPSGAHHPVLITLGHQTSMGPPVPLQIWVRAGKAALRAAASAALSRPLTTFSTQNFPVIIYQACGRKIAFLILLPCFSESCFQQLTLPAPAPGCFPLLL